MGYVTGYGHGVLDASVCISKSANTLRKGINLIILHSSLSSY